MGKKYNDKKLLDKKPKTRRQKFLSPQQVTKLLDAVKKNAPEETKRRDHAAIFLGFHLGLRVGETCRLKREHFKLMDDGTIYIPTLKRSPRIPYVCMCGRRIRVAVTRIGSQFPCPRCGKENTVKAPKNFTGQSQVPEIPISVIPARVKRYIRRYLEVLPEEQEYLFEGRSKGVPLSERHMQRIFNTYLLQTDLDPAYSYHALRHGHGVRIYEVEENLVAVRDLLRQKSVNTAGIYATLSDKRTAAYARKLDQEAIEDDDF